MPATLTTPVTTARWACIRTRPRAEQYAADNLYRVGHEVYLPMTSVRRRDRGTGRYETAEVPLFSSYLFIAHAPGSPWRGIRGAPGVGKLLLDGLKPQYARIGAVEMLQATEEARRNPVSEAAWKPGMACMIGQGAFSGHEAVIVDTTNAAALVDLFIFNELRSVTVPIDSLMPRGT
jgi:transcription antitermination factor NusG